MRYFCINERLVGRCLLPVLAAVLGFFVIVAPVLFEDGAVPVRGAFFHIVAESVERLALSKTAIAFCPLGVVLGALDGKRWVLLGFSFMAGFPCVGFVQVLSDPTSHNLWPIELLLYGVIALPAVLGAFLGTRLARLCRKRDQD